MIDVPHSEGYRFIVGPTDQLHLKKLYLYQLEKDLCPKKRALSTENQKALLINGGNFINVLFWSSAPRSFFRLLSRFQKVNKLKFGAKNRSTLRAENEFSNPTWMPSLTVLSIWDTVHKMSFFWQGCDMWAEYLITVLILSLNNEHGPF